MAKSLGEALPKELKRCRELLEIYHDLGSVGIFGHTAISVCMDEAESAMISGDLPRMIVAYERLKGCK